MTALQLNLKARREVAFGRTMSNAVTQNGVHAG